jgi:hypothetical protein
VQRARDTRRVLSVFHNRRWDRDYLAVRAAIASGVLGKLINVESRLGQFASCVGPAAREYRPGWRNEAAFGGGGLYDWGSHFVDQLWRLLWPAKPMRVFAQLRGNVWSGDCDDFARVIIDFDHGVAALMEINTTTSAPLPRWHLDGTSGSASSPHSSEFDTSVWADLRFTPGDSSAGIARKLPAELSEVLRERQSHKMMVKRITLGVLFFQASRDGGHPAIDHCTKPSCDQRAKVELNIVPPPRDHTCHLKSIEQTHGCQCVDEAVKQGRTCGHERLGFRQFDNGLRVHLPPRFKRVVQLALALLNP